MRAWCQYGKFSSNTVPTEPQRTNGEKFLSQADLSGPCPAHVDPLARAFATQKRPLCALSMESCLKPKREVDQWIEKENNLFADRLPIVLAGHPNSGKSTVMKGIRLMNSGLPASDRYCEFN